MIMMSRSTSVTNVSLSPKRANIQSDTDQGDNEQLQNAKRIKIPLEEMKSVDMDFVQLTERTLDSAGPKKTQKYYLDLSATTPKLVVVGYRN